MNEKNRYTLLLYTLLCLMLTGCAYSPALVRLDEKLVEMEMCRRTADNLAFYRSRQAAQKEINRLNRFSPLLSSQQAEHLAHAITQYQLQLAYYYYMMGQLGRAERVMQKVDEDNPNAANTRQWLAYRYLSGYYGYGPDAGRIGIRQCQELVRQLAEGDDYWRMESSIIDASLLTNDGEYMTALDTLASVEQFVADAHWPEMLSRVYEQMSVAYAGLDNKPLSDEYRNRYLDLLYEIRENKELPLRKSELETRWAFVRRLSIIMAVGMGVLIALFFFYARRWNKKAHLQLQRLDEQMEDDRLRREEQYAVHALQTERGKRDNVMRKASLSIITGIIPLINRMRHEVMRGAVEIGNGRAFDYSYVDELALEIERQNDILTDWIQTRQGMVNLHIETFALQELFDVLTKNSHSFVDYGLTFDVQPTEGVVKADRSLTLFMLTTLTDNARKYTPAGGHVNVCADVYDEYVELSVRDTGVGLSADDVARILNEKIYDASRIGFDSGPDVVAQKGSGFGILNCKGIIEKYRKTDELFAVCRFGVESEKGVGSRFWFRLPRAVRRVLLLVACLWLPLASYTQEDNIMAPVDTVSIHSADTLLSSAYDPLLEIASNYADKVYHSNVEQRYEDAFLFADSAFHYIELYRAKYATRPLPVLTAVGTGKPLEREWWMSDFSTDYHTLLDLRNELAVASLALHRWADYRFNNLAYTELYKLLSEDETLIDYCRSMRNSTNQLIGLTVLSVLTVLLFLLGYYLLSWRPRKHLRTREEERKRQLALELEEGSELRRIEREESRLYVQNQVLDNCLSTIKHETLSYPGRIHFLIQSGRTQQLPELVDYYSEVYRTLAACAARQLEENTFRPAAILANELMEAAQQYLQRWAARQCLQLTLEVEPSDCIVSCDTTLMHFFMETLIDNALSETPCEAAVLQFKAVSDGKFVRFTFVDPRPKLTREELQDYFSPSSSHSHIVMRQIIREHDEYYNHPGCRIEVRGATPTGIELTFSLPERKS